MKRLVARILVVLIALGASLLLVEGLVRWTGRAPSFEFQGLRVRLDPQLLYRAEPGGPHDLNALGFRDAEPRTKSGDRVRTLVLGDSFLMGLGVSPEETLPAALERALGGGHEVLNLGVSGYGPDQSLLLLEDVALSLDPDRVLLTLFPANDFEDLRKNELFVVGADGEIGRTASNPVVRQLRPLQVWPLVRRMTLGDFLPDRDQRDLVATLFRDTYDYELLRVPEARPSRYKRALMRGVLYAFRSQLESRGIPFAVVIVPSYENIQNDRVFRELGIPRGDYFRLETMVAEICSELGIPFVDLSGPFRAHRGGPLYLESDHHLSPVGAAVAARKIADSLR